MTGEDFDVSKLPYDEILKMNILSKIPYYRREGMEFCYISYTIFYDFEYN